MGAQSSPPLAVLANATKGPAQAPLRKRKPAANPLVKPKRPGQPRQPLQRTGTPSQAQNGINIPQQDATASIQSAEEIFGEDEFEDIPIFSTRHSLLKDARYHIMRLFPNTNVERKDINPADPSQFTPPVKLHRRDPRSDPSSHWQASGIEESTGDEKKAFPYQMDDKALEAAAIAKAERAAERVQNQSQIAPTLKSEATKQKPPRQKKTEMVYQFTDSLVKAKNQQIRYEESLPWHLEDFDNKNLWAGTYEAALSERHVMLIVDDESKTLRMVPLEKWYKFLPKSHFKTLSIEQAEAKMNTKHIAPRWFQRTVETDQQVREAKERSIRGKILTRQGERGEKSMKSVPGRASDGGDEERREQAVDADLIDYDYEEAFADDEENPILGGDEEEVKAAEEKLQRERLEANVFDIKEDKDYDEEEELEKQQAEEEKQKARKLTRALKKREKNFDYDDSEVESEESSEEEEEATTKYADKDGEDTVMTGDGETSPPSASQPKDGKKQNKRPASPGHSDLSGNESSRKKKQKRDSTMEGASISRPGSPTNGSGTVIRPRRIGDLVAGSGSEGEMSDGKGRRIKKKLNRNSAGPSRSGSPPVSGPASPANATATAKGPKPPKYYDGPIPSAEEVLSIVPESGMSLETLKSTFPKGLLVDPRFTELLKAILRFETSTKTFYLRLTPTDAES